MGTYQQRWAPDGAAVLVVDVQNDFCHPRGASAQNGSDVSAAVDMVPRLQRFIADARDAGVMVVFVRTTHDELTDSAVWLGRGGDRTGDVAPTYSCYTGSWGAELYKVRPATGEAEVIKHRYSGFTGTDLEVILRAAGIGSLMIAGVNTNVCVDSTLRDAFSRDFHVTLVEDCISAYEAELHRATLQTVATYFGAVATSTQISRTWISGTGPAVPEPVDPPAIVGARMTHE